jgi:hypothetical protein
VKTLSQCDNDEAISNCMKYHATCESDPETRVILQRAMDRLAWRKMETHQ